MLFLDQNSTLSTDITVHRAGSQLKMSESQTGAGNLKNLNFLKFLKTLNVNIKNDPRDMLNNFCFHVYAQKSLFIVENTMVIF